MCEPAPPFMSRGGPVMRGQGAAVLLALGRRERRAVGPHLYDGPPSAGLVRRGDDDEAVVVTAYVAPLEQHGRLPSVRPVVLVVPYSGGGGESGGAGAGVRAAAVGCAVADVPG